MSSFDLTMMRGWRVALSLHCRVALSRLVASSRCIVVALHHAMHCAVPPSCRRVHGLQCMCSNAWTRWCIVLHTHMEMLLPWYRMEHLLRVRRVCIAYCAARASRALPTVLSVHLVVQLPDPCAEFVPWHRGARAELQPASQASHLLLCTCNPFHPSIPSIRYLTCLSSIYVYQSNLSDHKHASLRIRVTVGGGAVGAAGAGGASAQSPNTPSRSASRA